MASRLHLPGDSHYRPGFEATSDDEDVAGSDFAESSGEEDQLDPSISSQPFDSPDASVRQREAEGDAFSSIAGDGVTRGTSSDQAASGSSAAPQSRTRRRTIRACEGCRKKKIACNGKQPCAACHLRSRDCVYTSLTVTGRPSKGALKLLQHQIQELEKEVEMLRSRQGHVHHSAPIPLQHNASSAYGATSKSGIGESSSDAQSQEPSSTTSVAFGPEAYEQRRDSVTTRHVDDYFFLESDFIHKVNINDDKDEKEKSIPNEGLRRKMLMLHTSFRLDPNPEDLYMTGSGNISRTFRLARALAGEKYSEERSFKFEAEGEDAAPDHRSQKPTPDPYAGIHPQKDVELHWPSREREDQLCNVYFRLIHPTVPILSREILTLQRSHAFRSTFEKDPIWLSIMLGIFISAARYICTERVHCHAWWKARMELGTYSIAYSRSIGGLQNLLLTSEASFDLFTPTHSVWLSIGVALRSMQARGLHREKVVVEMPYDAEWKDIVRCLWWTAQKHDIELCTVLGYPPAALTFDLLPPKTSSKISPMPYFRAMTKGLKIKAQATDMFACRSPAYRRRQIEESDSWLKELKTYLPFVPKEKDDEKFFACAKLWLNAYSIVSATRRYGMLSSLSRIFVPDERSPIGFRLKDDGFDDDKNVGDFERGELDNCMQSLRTAIRNTSVIAEALIKRSTKDICFVDSDVCRCIYILFAEACLLFFIDSFLGRADKKMLEYTETFVRAIQVVPDSDIGSPHWHIQTMASSMLRHLRKRIANQDAAVLTSMYPTLASASSRSKQGMQGAARGTAPDSTWLEGALGRNDAPQNVVFSGSGYAFVPSEGGGSENYAMPFQGVLTDQASSQVFSTASEMPPLTGMTVPSQQYDAASGMPNVTSPQPTNKISPDSKVWNDFLQSEVMMLDPKETFINTGAGGDPLFMDPSIFSMPMATTPAPPAGQTSQYDFLQQPNMAGLPGSDGAAGFGQQTPATTAAEAGSSGTAYQGMPIPMASSSANITPGAWLDPTTGVPRFPMSWLGPNVGEIVSPPMQHLYNIGQPSAFDSGASAQSSSASPESVTTSQGGAKGQNAQSTSASTQASQYQPLHH